jgi:ADP-heptose:LPS heptosyltransferase
MPNWLGDNVMALPILRSLRLCRPSEPLTLLCQPAYAKWLEALALADAVIPLPRRGISYFFRLGGVSYARPNLYVTFTNSFRGAVESLILGAPVRIGFAAKRARRQWWLTNLPPDRVDGLHRTAFWHMSLGVCGLSSGLSDEPIPVERRSLGKSPSIAIFCGASNDRRTKCWPVEKWRELALELVALLPDVRLLLLGAPCDVSDAREICRGLPDGCAADLAGATTVLELAKVLCRCDLAISADSGGMHLANCCAVPTVALFGPSNPLETGPFYVAPKAVVQPPNCPPGGGLPMELIPVSAVVESALQLLAQR